ncbi:MAG TPA: L,D-transpeptidase family protein [Gemmatimonadaceae bacterium]|nr:L,D-transpeptidase family protein [Gemmatimonadaceae bacterium]
MTTHKRFLGPAAIVAVIFAFAACSRGDSATTAEPAATWSPEQLTAVNGVPIAQLQAVMEAKLSDAAPVTIDAEQWRHAKKLYETYGGNPLWLTANGLHEQRTKALTDAILNAHADALRLDDYPIGRLATALAAVKQAERPTAEQLVEADVMLTATYAALGEDLLTGQINPRTVAQSWHVDPQEENVDSALARGLRIAALDKSLATMRPQDSDYAALSRELLRYREIVVRGGWPRVPDTESVKPGESIPVAVAEALRARLAAEGITVPAAPQRDTAARRAPGTPAASAQHSTTVYDRGLAAAVAQFQARHTIVVDSVLGGGTLEALNQPAQYRLAQIAANMERYRWLPRTFGSRYIFVNVPAFRLEAYDGGRKALEMRVIVGEEYEDRATPVFSDSMSYVVFRPYWLVPPSIAQNEIFPKGSAYIAANNMEVYRAQGERRVRQRPGPENSLGLLKFMFPNDFNIYLHDTPHGDLFEEDIRAFSHGCIRVEKPDQLGAWVLGWPADSVRNRMENGPDDHTVQLDRKIPVYIAYVTTFMRNGALHFGNDLYSRDDKLIPAVAPAALPTARAVEAVQALRRIAEG